MAQRESKKSREIMRALEAEGAFCFKIHGGASMMAGLPDIICCHRGRFYGFETKMPGGKPSKIQLFIHRKIRAAGGICEVVLTPADALALLVHDA